MSEEQPTPPRPAEEEVAKPNSAAQVHIDNAQLNQNNFYLQPTLISEIASVKDSAPELYEAYVEGLKTWNETWAEDTRESRNLSYKFLRRGQYMAVFVTVIIFGAGTWVGVDGHTALAGLLLGANVFLGVAGMVRAFTGKSSAQGANLPDETP